MAGDQSLKYPIAVCATCAYPDSKQVVKWISGITEANLFISVLTNGELHKGIEKLPESKKKEKLHKWVNCDLKERFKDRIISFDLQTATTWGKIQARSESAGKTMPAIRRHDRSHRNCKQFNYCNTEYIRYGNQRGFPA